MERSECPSLLEPLVPASTMEQLSLNGPSGQVDPQPVSGGKYMKNTVDSTANHFLDSGQFSDQG